ncbi:MAG: PAS domain S-box protein [Bacteroidetes bacterium]|nr:PAS domain S-box protein [Bacteroidota bacterium]
MSQNSNDLRKRAEEILRQRRIGKVADPGKMTTEKLLEELSIYQVELELQNEELKHSQEVLDNSRKQYIELFDNAPVGYIIIDEDFIIHNCNLTFSNMLKYPRNALKEKKLSKFIHPDDQDKAYLACKRLFEEKQISHCELVLRTGNDQNIYTSINAVYFSNENGHSYARLAISDITERIEHERIINETRAEIASQNDMLRRKNEELTKQSALMASQYEDLLALNEEVASLNEELQAQNEELSSSNEELNRLNISLHIEKEKARQYLDIAGNMFIAIDNHGKVILVNKKASEILGYPEQEILGKDWFDHFLPQDNIAEIKKVFNALITGETGWIESLENNIITRKGETRIISWKNSIIRDPEGNIAGTLSSGEDVTAIREKEKELKKIEWLLQSRKSKKQYAPPVYGDLTELNKNGLILNHVGKEVLMDIASDYLSLLETSAAIYEKNGDYALGLFSSNWCRYLDVASRDLCKNCDNREALQSGKWHCHESCWKDASLKSMQTGKPVETECNGGLFIYAIPITVGDKVIGSINFGHGDPPKDEEKLKEIAERYDVPLAELERLSHEYETRPAFIIDLAKERLGISAKLIGEMVLRQQTALELEASQAAYTEIYHGSRDGFVMVDPEGRFIDCNTAYSRMLGYTLEELKSLEDFYEITAEPWREWEKREIWDKKLIKKQYSGTYEKEYIHKNGRIFPVELQAYPVTDKNGNIQYLWAVARDISERKKTEEELIQARDQAKESDRLKTAFLANMSHEIRTPMNGILGFASLLKESGLTREQLKKYIQVIEESGIRMLNTINDIIDISKIESGQMEVYISPVNINDEIRSLYRFFEAEAGKKGLKIESFCPLPWQDANLQTDKSKFYAVFSNLLKNAMKYTHKGNITFGYEVKNKFLEFFVKDTGIGIARDKQGIIFNRFVQEENGLVHSYEGSGLGLAISRAYVEMLGGQIWVKSQKNRGSEFYFSLPHQTMETQNPETMENKEKNKNKPFSKDVNALIAEDIPSSDALLTEILKNHCRTIFHASNGQEAIEIAREHPEINLILMDIKMPGLNGYEATEEIRKTRPGIVIIAQTAYALYGDREKAIEAGCDDYITKPIRKEDLLEIIAKHL